MLYTAEIYTVSQSDTTPPFGGIGPFTVRTAAFGSIPAEAEVVVEQALDETGLPIPLRYSQWTGAYCEHTSPFPRPAGSRDEPRTWLPAEIHGPVQISIRSLRVDGVDVGLTGTCQAETLSDLKLTSRHWHAWDPALRPEDNVRSPDDVERLMTTRYFQGTTGGKLTGTVNIPAFTGCTTSGGDDLSPILTATVSAEENDIEMRTTGISAAAGEDSCAWANACEPMPGIPFPEGDG